MTPEEANAQLQQLASRRAIANAMLQGSINEPSTWGRDRFRHSPWEALANLATVYVNKGNLAKADQASQDFTKQRQAEIAQALTQYEGASTDPAVGPQGRQLAQQTLASTALGPEKIAQAKITAALTPPKKPQISDVSPKDFTPESLLKFQKSGNYTDLMQKEGGGGLQKTDSGLVFDPAKGQYRDSTGRVLTSEEVAKRERELAAAKAGDTAAARTGSSGFDDTKIQDLQAAISSAGFSLPAGFRSKDQQLSLFKGLLRKYDGLAPDDIAHLLASNAIDYKSVTKATQAAATIGGRVEVANNELQAFVPIAKDASALVDRGVFTPFNKLKQAGQASISDPNLKRLFVATQTILNAYDLLAARGGTDKDKRAENHKILENADSPEAYNAALDMIVREGQAAGGAAAASMKASAFGYGKEQQSDTGAKVDFIFNPATGKLEAPK